MYEQFVYGDISGRIGPHPVHRREPVITEQDRPQPLLESPLHLLRRALQSYAAQWNSVVGDVTPPQYAVLLTIHERPGIDQSRLGEITGIDFATLAPLVHRLEQRGVLDRQVDPANRRRKLLTLTEAGVRSVERIRPLSESVDEHVFSGIPADMRATFVEALQRISAAERPGA
ncbi:MarR family winged helix-turn-helix transcriptional regulator [Streptomyces sp. NPDC002588]|uniref:MarR family winged helix-turn-helix transcriptional regulator n=1 Tax=Streptomyces sp. NPDC002588 TaxID=3154419 RepID=UPI00331D7FAF